MQKDERIIVIKTGQKKAEDLENSILKIKRILGNIRNACADRTREIFPHEDVANLVRECEEAKKLAADTVVSEEYLEYVAANKSILDYYEEKFRSAQAEEQILQKKRTCFKRFAEGLRRLQKDQFL